MPKNVGTFLDKGGYMPSKKNHIVPFQDVLADLLKWLKGYPVVIIGGVAVSLLGRPRHTQDIDAMMLLDNEEWKKLLKNGKKFGFAPRIDNAIKFAQKNRVLLIKHINSSIGIDISFGALPFEEECIKRSRKIRLANINLPLPSAEDLIIMKAVSHRSKDIIDIESIVDANPNLDIQRIKLWVTEFAALLEMPELWEDIEKLILKSK